jgi:hypothetical protein
MRHWPGLLLMACLCTGAEAPLPPVEVVAPAQEVEPQDPRFQPPAGPGDGCQPPLNAGPFAVDVEEAANSLEPLELGPSSGPGRAPAVHQPPAIAVEFVWPGYRTLVVIEAAHSGKKWSTAWVVTWTARQPSQAERILESLLALGGLALEPDVPVVAVAYRARAHRDIQGVIHVDARAAWLSGDWAQQWSPDSFALRLPDQVETMDDQGNQEKGRIERLINPEKEPKVYEDRRRLAQILVGGA